MNSPTKASAKQQNLAFLELLQLLKKDFSDVSFTTSDSFYWSADKRAIFYDPKAQNASWSVLHELGHMHHEHNTYNSDMRLLKMEAEAWDSAIHIAKNYGITIDNDYIQDCIDSYRYWQHKRSLCPACNLAGVETKSGKYRCVNCQQEWTVSTNRFCRVYRKQKTA